MAASHNDSFQLAQDATFQGRVGASLWAACIAIGSESGLSVPFHRERQTFASAILSNLTSPNPYAAIFANAVSTDATVLSDATQGGTVTLTSGNRATQAALVTDAHIDAAISGEFNAFIRTPAN